MTGHIVNIEEVSLSNNNFRQVLYTSTHSQLVVMSLLPLEDIGEETHESVDQFIKIESGEAEVFLNGESQKIKEGFTIVIPAGIKHNIINLSANKHLKLYTLYSPPHHKDKTIHATKKDAETDQADHY